jgi:hypothetical protein
VTDRARPAADDEAVRGTEEGTLAGTPTEEQVGTPPPDLLPHAPEMPVPPVTDDPIIDSVLAEDWGRQVEDEEGTLHGGVPGETEQA